VRKEQKLDHPVDQYHHQNQFHVQDRGLMGKTEGRKNLKNQRYMLLQNLAPEALLLPNLIPEVVHPVSPEKPVDLLPKALKMTMTTSVKSRRIIGVQVVVLVKAVAGVQVKKTIEVMKMKVIVVSVEANLVKSACSSYFPSHCVLSWSYCILSGKLGAL